MKYNYLFFFLIFLSSCSWLQSDYDKLMNPVKEMKLAEKKAGKPNPTIDGVVEPDFPDEDENNKTFEGVDSNKDGIRDDIEIWINRISENKEVRIATKHYYKMSTTFVNGAISNSTVAVNTKNHDNSAGALYCLAKAFGKLRKEYLKTKNIAIERERASVMVDLIYNNINRKEKFQISEHVELNSSIIVPEENYSFCSSSNDLKLLKQKW